MLVNLAIAKTRLVDRFGNRSIVDLISLKNVFPWIRKTSGRADFYIYSNKYTVTKTGYVTAYISQHITDALRNLPQTIKELTNVLEHFCQRRPYALRYRYTNIQLSGRLSLTGAAILKRILEILRAGEQPYDCLSVQQLEGSTILIDPLTFDEAQAISFQALILTYQRACLRFGSRGNFTIVLPGTHLLHYCKELIDLLSPA